MRDWSDLKILAAVVRGGSLAAAGRALKLHHATIGRRIAALERELGVKLIDRLPRQAVATPAGAEIAALAGQVEDLIDAVARRGRGGRGAVAGTVSISAPPIIASESLAAGLAPLLAAHPALRIVLQSSATLASLTRGDVDIAVRLAQPDQPGLVARRVSTVDLALYATREIVARPPATWRFIGYDDALAHVPHHRWFETFVADRPVVLRSSDVHVQQAAARAGVGVAMLPTRFAESMDDLVRVDTAAVPPARTVWLLVHPDLRRSPAVRVVLDHLAALFASAPANG